MKHVKPGIAIALGAIASTLTASEALASAFALRENSGITGGEAHAGAVSGAADLSTIYDNPAGMVYFDGIQTSQSGTVVDPSGHLSNTKGTTAFGTPVNGGDGRSPAQTRLIPAAYLLYAPTNDLRFGLALTVPFGLITSYSDDSAVRYQALYSEVKSLDINPNVAYRVNNWLSVGGGFTVEKVKVKLTNAVDFGGIIGAQADALTGGVLHLGQALTQTADGRSDLQGTSWGVGYNFGAMFQVDPDTRIGVTYRSGIDHKIRGRANFALPVNSTNPIVQQGLAIGKGLGLFQNTGASADLNLPGNFWIGVTHEFTPNFGMDLSYQYTQWSSFKAIVVNFDNPAQPQVNSPENYKDSSYVGLGGHYKLNQAVTLRGGVAWDQTPVQDAYRDYRIPDSNRYWISTGITYQVTDSLSINGSYSHLFFDSANVNHVNSNPTNDVVSSTANITADLFAVSATMKF